uniref:hypothetical protein n=1 Tax=Aliarcobacter sp. TaxID=2321116 RepID=UPI004048CB86
MEYSIYLNQARCIDWKLTYPEAILCSYYANEHNWVRTKINESDGDYFCITIAKLIKDLPIIGTSKFPFSKALNSLVEKGLFEKIVDEENSKTVFYRILPAAKVWWKYPEVCLASSIQNRSLVITNVFKELQVLLNDNTIIKELQVLSKIEKVLSNDNEVLSNDNEVLSNDNLSYNYNHNTNHITNNHNMENDDDSLKNKNNTKENTLKTEFDKLFQLFPETVNNTPKNLALAFGSYSKLTQSQRFDLLKAVKNYSKTKQVKDHQQKKTTNFIQSLNSFITKSYTEFVYGLPDNYIFAEEFEVPQKSNGGENEILEDFQVLINGNFVVASDEIRKFQKAKKIMELDNFRTNGAETYDYSKVKALFTENEFEIVLKMGIDSISKYEPHQLAESLLESTMGGN